MDNDFFPFALDPVAEAPRCEDVETWVRVLDEISGMESSCLTK